MPSVRPPKPRSRPTVLQASVCASPERHRRVASLNLSSGCRAFERDSSGVVGPSSRARPQSAVDRLRPRASARAPAPPCLPASAARSNTRDLCRVRVPRRLRGLGPARGREGGEPGRGLTAAGLTRGCSVVVAAGGRFGPGRHPTITSHPSSLSPDHRYRPPLLPGWPTSTRPSRPRPSPTSHRRSRLASPSPGGRPFTNPRSSPPTRRRRRRQRSARPSAGRRLRSAPASSSSRSRPSRSGLALAARPRLQRPPPPARRRLPEVARRSTAKRPTRPLRPCRPRPSTTGGAPGRPPLTKTTTSRATLKTTRTGGGSAASGRRGASRSSGGTRSPLSSRASRPGRRRLLSLLLLAEAQPRRRPLGPRTKRPTSLTWASCSVRSPSRLLVLTALVPSQ